MCFIQRTSWFRDTRSGARDHRGRSCSPAAIADSAAVQNYGTCVANGGLDPSTGIAAPQTIVVNSQGVKVGLPHQSVDGFPPQAFEGGGWSACGR